MAPTLIDLAPERAGPPALVVVTPGFDREAFVPLARALRGSGMDVQLVDLGCGGEDAAALAEGIAAAAATTPGPDVVVAHGLGAALALRAAPSVDAERYVLLAPLIGVVPSASIRWLAERPVGPSVELSAPLDWNGRSIAEVVLGDGAAPLGCLSGPLAAELQRWALAAEVPVALEAVAAPVWIAVSLGDELATVEAVIPASRRLPSRAVVRLGVNRMDRRDFTHLDLLVEPAPVRAAARAAARGWRIREEGR
jgi:alpha-beta hydrolase superfamily lysophospholipase